MKKSSIIFTCWNQAQSLAQISMCALASIRAYTNPAEYELIVVDTMPKFEMLDSYHVLDFKGEKTKNTKYIRNKEDKGYCANMNQGAKLATGDYLVFYENDIIVSENWLPNLRYYLDNDLADVVCPNQVLGYWQQMEEYKKKSFEEAISPGIQEQGMMMIRKEIFEKTGGWDERFKKIYGWAAYKKRLVVVTSRIITTDKVFINHIAGSTYWWSVYYDKENYEKVGHQEALVLEKEFR